ncbi:hypothetical protein IJ843_06330 [bacterium]|nr:hypothetical protein [bacterium]
MGMSASQARLLSITSRINDIELKSQQVANIKMRLASESEAVATKYTNALNKQALTFTSYGANGATTTALNSDTISGSGYTLKSRNGQTAPSKYNEAELYEMIESGEFYLEKSGKEVSVSSEVTLAISSYDKDLAKEEAEYNAATLKINNKEKKLDMEMKALDTEHNALSTEYDSVKQLIGDNIDKSFQLFS